MPGFNQLQNNLYGPQMNYGNQNLYSGYAPQVQVDPSSGSMISAMNPNMFQQQQGLINPQLSPWQKFGYVMDGIGAIGGLWGAIQQNKLARDQLNFTKEAYNTNMNNSIQSYNTALEDRIRARYAMEGKSDSEVNSYLDANKLYR